jgi:hypothetical protein
MFMLATALHLDSDVRVFCSNEKDNCYVTRLVNYLNIPVKIEAPKADLENKWEYYRPTVYNPIGYRGGYCCSMDTSRVTDILHTMRYSRYSVARKVFLKK